MGKNYLGVYLLKNIIREFPKIELGTGNISNERVSCGMHSLWLNFLKQNLSQI